MDPAGASESISWLWWPLFAVINVPLLAPLFQWLFGGLSGFGHALVRGLMPLPLSILRGAFEADREAAFNVLLFGLATAALFFAERALVLRLF